MQLANLGSPSGMNLTNGSEQNRPMTKLPDGSSNLMSGWTASQHLSLASSAPATPVSNRYMYTRPLHKRKPCTYCGSLFHFSSNCHKVIPMQSFCGARQNPVPGRLSNPTPTTRGNISQSASPLSTHRACWNFSATGECSSAACQFAHSCGVCNGTHSLS